MASASIVRFRPTGPWRFGPDSGSRGGVDLIYHSDSVFAAVSHAMQQLGDLEEWLEATARNQADEPEVRFSSLFPFQEDTLYVAPPRSVWPPPPSPKLRYKGARFIPLQLAQALLAEQPVDEDRWTLDGESQCLVPANKDDRRGPFRIAVRSSAAVDRLNAAATEPHSTACIEFSRDAGLWLLAVFAGDEARDKWEPRVRSALRLLADTGFGGERSRGWGRSLDPEWSPAPEFAAPQSETAYWLLSLYAPAESDTVDWKTGNYATIARTGRVESAAAWGALKRETMMIAEGSVLVAAGPPRGEARDVAPPDFPHPVFRAGFAVAIPIAWRGAP